MIDRDQQFAISGELAFTTNPQGARLIEIENASARAALALQGAQLLDWTPVGQAPVLWLSPGALYREGKAVRGGIPVCWPWFGPHPENPAFPAHGFARTRSWQVIGSEKLLDSTRVTLCLDATEVDPKLWPHQALVTLTVTVGTELRLDLATENRGDTALEVSQALHSYLAVGDIAAVTVEGLEGTDYIDQLQDARRLRQKGPVVIGEEVDRIYLGGCPELQLLDTALGRRIRIAQSGSASTVVWNPWADKAARLGDMGPAESYRQMLCLETANAADDAVTIPPGGAHRLSVEFSATAL